MRYNFKTDTLLVTFIENFTLKKPRLLTSLFFLFIICVNTNAQGLPSGEESSKIDTAKNFKFLPIPYLSYDRTLGASFGALPMAMYHLNKADTVSPASISGLLGMYTTNDTWFAMFFQKFYFNQDNWRIATAGGLGSVNFQFYLEAPLYGYIDYNTKMDFFAIKAQRRIYNKLYAGFIYQYTKFNSTLRNNDIEFSYTELHGIGISAALDVRDNIYYPLAGSLTELKWMSFPELFDNTNVSNKLDFEHNHFINNRQEKDVIATRLYVGMGLGDLTFNQQFVVGQSDIRGYTQGKYRGNYTVALQGEYRWNLHEKISLVGFFGLATVYESINEEHNGLVLPGGGAGFRYNVFPEYHMNVGMDFAVGKDDWGIYFRIGEAF